MKNLKTNLIKYRFEILFSFICLSVIFLPYIQQDLIIGSDTPFHLARIETLKQNILYGAIPSKIHIDLCYGYGYGVGFFYPDVFLYIPALLQTAGLSLEISFKLFAGLILAGIYISVFFCAFQLTKDRIASLSSAAVFLFSNQVLGSLFYEFTLGTSLGLIFMPLAICGMYLFITENNRKPYMLCIGFSGLIFSHVLSTFLAFLVCFILLIIHYKHLIQSPRKIIILLYSVCVVASITACFWLPMFEQFLSQRFKVSQPWTTVDANTVSLVRLFWSDGLGFTLTSAVILMAFYFISNKELPDKVKIFYPFGFILLLLPSSHYFWRTFRDCFNFIQFPRRLLGPASLLFIFSFAVIFSNYCRRAEIKKLLSCIILLFAIYNGYQYIDSRIGFTEDFGNRTLYNEIAGIGAGEEWLPLETTRDFLTTPNIVTTDKGTTIEGIHEKRKFIFQADSSAIYYDIPLVWYKGYKAENSDGQDLNISKNPRTGLVRVFSEQSINQTDGNIVISIQYKATVLQIISYILSGISFLVMLLFLSSKRWHLFSNK